MHDVLRFWLDRGVDGFRMDVIHAIGKDPALPDNPPRSPASPTPRSTTRRGPTSCCAASARCSTRYDGDRMSVGEVFLLDTAKVADVPATRRAAPGVQLPAAVRDSGGRDRWARRLDDVADPHRAGGWPTWVLSNHDNPRHRTRYGVRGRARAAAVLLLGLRGTPFLYAGEELGLEDAEVPPERVVDPGGRDGCRAPMPWDRSRRARVGDGEPWLPLAAGRRRAATSRRSGPTRPRSCTSTGALLAARKASPALQVGEQARIDAPEGVLAWERTLDGDRRLVAVNFTGETVAVPGLAGTVEVSSDRSGEGEPFSGTLAPDQAVWPA